MRIKEDEPLPKHTKVDWEECYAKVVLEKIYKDEFSRKKGFFCFQLTQQL